MEWAKLTEIFSSVINRMRGPIEPVRWRQTVFVASIKFLRSLCLLPSPDLLNVHNWMKHVPIDVRRQTASILQE
jgi:hypothetical protein